MTHNALETLWGSGDVERDRRRKNTAKSLISPSGARGDFVDVERKQEIFTPASIYAFVTRLWPEGIVCDPCWAPGTLVTPPVRYDGAALGDGLTNPWFPRTFFNPPYADLSTWIHKMVNEAARVDEILMLAPVRTHRRWYRAMLELCDRNAWLDPLMFIGYAQAFPAPLALTYFGKRGAAFDLAKRTLYDLPI